MCIFCWYYWIYGERECLPEFHLVILSPSGKGKRLSLINAFWLLDRSHHVALCSTQTYLSQKNHPSSFYRHQDLCITFCKCISIIARIVQGKFYIIFSYIIYILLAWLGEKYDFISNIITRRHCVQASLPKFQYHHWWYCTV